MTLTVLKNFSQIFLECLMIVWWLHWDKVFWDDTREKVLFSLSHIRFMSLTWLITAHLNFDYFVEVVIVGFLNQNITLSSMPLFLHWALWKVVTKWCLNLKDGQLCSTSQDEKEKYPFIYSITYFSYGLMHSYFIFCIIILQAFVQITLALVIGNSFSWYLCHFDIHWTF